MGVIAILVIIDTVCSATKCTNSADEFSVGKGDKKETTSCNLIAAQSEEDRLKDCKKSKIKKKCPGLCKKDKCPCVDFPIEFTFENADEEEQTQSCEEVADLGKSRREKKCNREEIAEKCPSICDQNCATIDPCENFDGEFEFNSGQGGDGDVKIITCEKVESLDEKGKKNKCNKVEILENCPGVCDDECSINCDNVSGSFSYKDKKDTKETTCEDVESLEKKDKDKKCKKDTISENCPGVCDKDCEILAL